MRHPFRFLLPLLLALSTAVWAEPTVWKEYTPVQVPQQPETGKKIEVREFFSYACPHCAELEPQLQKWQARLPRDAVLIRTPVAFRPEWELGSRAYFALESMGALQKVHAKLFAAIHEQGRRNLLSDEKALADWVATQGMAREKFLANLHSFDTERKLGQAKSAAMAFGIDGVPTLGVDGKFLTSASMNGSYPRMLETTTFLIQKARRERGGKH